MKFLKLVALPFVPQLRVSVLNHFGFSSISQIREISFSLSQLASDIQKRIFVKLISKNRTRNSEICKEF